MPLFPDEQSIASALVACRDAPPAERARLESDVVTFYLPMTHALARRYRFKGVDLDDLEQVADLALVKAIRRFDPAAGSLRGYVTATVLGEIKRYFRDFAWCVRPPRQVQDLQAQVVEAWHELHDDLPQRDRVARVAHDLGVDDTLVTEVLLARGAFRALSLDRPMDDGAHPLKDQIADAADPFRQSEHRAFLSTVCNGLNEDELELLRLRYVEELSQREIADRVRSTQKQVSRTLDRILRSLRQRALADAA